MSEKGCLKEIFVALNVGAQGRKSMPLLTILDKAMPFRATCMAKKAPAPGGPAVFASG
ncbi:MULTISPECIES: hypothetical protein [Mesorhizobium]|uniref:hypothetical protein n=1 Tax=Mesorhizobium TaxID=68287 RepID=UPI0012EBD058|nr:MULTISPECIES: hypothetical protein [Mesorhizobium]WJI37383.1 hypothetical protein NL534_26440 [Mesorhizobium opportunistum]